MTDGVDLHLEDEAVPEIAVDLHDLHMVDMIAEEIVDKGNSHNIINCQGNSQLRYLISYPFVVFIPNQTNSVVIPYLSSLQLN